MAGKVIKTKVSYNELELFLIEKSGSKENVYKTIYNFKLSNSSIIIIGRIKRIGKDWLLIQSKDVDRVVGLNNINSIE